MLTIKKCDARALEKYVQTICSVNYVLQVSENISEGCDETVSKKTHYHTESLGRRGKESPLVESEESSPYAESSSSYLGRV